MFVSSSSKGRNRVGFLGQVLATILVANSAAAESPWNGSWRLDVARSSPAAKEGAAAGYRFHFEADGKFRWEIPSLNEVVLGKIGGTPAAIRRDGKDTGLTLSLKAEGIREMTYQVARHGKLLGGGRMTLVDNGTAWVDLTSAAGQPEMAHQIVYVKQ
jgi:hypothetical protein